MVQPALRRRRVWCDAGDRERGALFCHNHRRNTVRQKSRVSIPETNERPPETVGRPLAHRGRQGQCPRISEKRRSVRVQRYLPSCHRREPRRSDEACEAIPHALPHQQCANLRETQAVADGQQTGVAASPRHKVARESRSRRSRLVLIGCWWDARAAAYRSLSGRAMKAVNLFVGVCKIADDAPAVVDLKRYGKRHPGNIQRRELAGSVPHRMETRASADRGHLSHIRGQSTVAQPADDAHP